MVNTILDTLTFLFFFGITVWAGYKSGFDSYILVKHLFVLRKMRKLRDSLHSVYENLRSQEGSGENLLGNLFRNETDINLNLSKTTMVINTSAIKLAFHFGICLVSFIILHKVTR